MADKMIKSDYKLRRVSFDESLILSCTDYDENDISLIGFTHCFIQMYLPFDKEWVSSFTRVYQDLDVLGDYYLVRVYLRRDGEICCDGYGASRELNRASDYACHKLARSLFDRYPSFIMPPYLIGFPNVRGHCYLISAVMPILYSYPVVFAIFESYLQYCKNANLTGNSLKKVNIYPNRPLVERPFFWIKFLYDIIKAFHKVSREGQLSLVNVGFLQKKLCPELRNDPVFPERPQKPDRDLLLDSRLIKGLCSIMTNYCDPVFGKPGGDEGYAYRHIISKLVSQVPASCDDLTLSMELKYVCSFCVGGPFISKFTTPVIMVPSGVGFQSLLDNAVFCAGVQGFQQPHDYNDIHCAGKIRSIKTARFLNRPKVLCFSVSAEGSETEVIVPRTLHLRHQDERYTYKLLCSSVCFQCYQSKDGYDYEEFYHEYEEGDQEIGWHTYVHMETKHGTYEVNNGSVYNVDTRVFRVVTPSSMHFFQLEEFHEFLPLLKEGCVKDKPHHIKFRVSPDSDVTPSEGYNSSSDYL